jgi:rSAM/selenodomain-associated transferase 1
MSQEQRAKDRLIIFTRYPVPGKTKTRLIPALGVEGAAALQKQMTERTVARARQLCREGSLILEVRYEGGRASGMQEWLGSDLAFAPQGSGHLGLRMGRAFQEAFRSEGQRVVLVGTDCPGLSVPLLRKAFHRLHKNDVVLGPAGDGGYYLLGLRFFVPDIFEGIPWGTSVVLEETLKLVEPLHLRVFLLKTLDDVDRPEDLPTWERVFLRTNPPRRK